MFSINSGKRTIEEIDGIRCSIVETGATEERVKFLIDLLEFNKYEVKVMEEKKPAPKAPVPAKAEGQAVVPPPVIEQPATKLYTIGVTDLMFFATIAIYERALKTREGHHVTPAYWKQYTTVCDPRYWKRRTKPSIT